MNLVKLQFPEELLVRFEPEFEIFLLGINIVKFQFQEDLLVRFEPDF